MTSVFIDGGYLCYWLLTQPETYYKPWAKVDALCDSGATICIDSSLSLRKQQYPWYKQARGEMTGQQLARRDAAHKLREGMIERYGSTCCVAVEGCEADDLMGYYASPGDILITEDKDLFQVPGVTFMDLFGAEWGQERIQKKCKSLPIAQGEKWLAYQLCIGDVTDGIPRFLETKDRLTLPTVMKYDHPLQLLIDMYKYDDRMWGHLHCLMTPTPLFTGIDTIKYLAERYKW